MNMKYVNPNDCDCYKCTEPEYDWRNGMQVLTNNMEHHTFGQPCERCGNPRTEYKDLGRKGRYVCWYCNYRTANLEEVDV